MTPLLELASGFNDCDALVIAVAQDSSGPRVLPGAGVTAKASSDLSDALSAIQATGAIDEVLRLPGAPYGLPPVIASGVGTDPATRASLGRAAGAALRIASAPRINVAFPTACDPQLVEAVAIGAALGAYRYPGKPSGPVSVPGTDRISIAVTSTDGLDVAIQRSQCIAEAILLARRLTDAPPGLLPPERLAQEARDAVRDTEISIEVLDEVELRRKGFGGITGVGQGSVNPPRLVRLSYSPPGWKTHLALVGKGITFDSGGLSLKPASGMVTMKMDMAGAAAVLAATLAIAALRTPVRLTGYLALAENMPGGGAQRPGDVVTAYGGKTVEVLNTDAEGRLVMMDALVRACEDSPDALIDIATLTGAQIVALGSRIAGVMGNNDEWRDKVHTAATAVGELTWPMPIPEELKASLESPVADLANIGERNGSMMTAAAFLREFVPEDLRWAHLDIAGPAFNEGIPWGWNGKGATGFGVRTLIEIAEQMGRDGQF